MRGTWKSLGWLGCAPLLWVLAAEGQAYRTPARASWTEDPATTATIAWDVPEAGRGTVRYGTTPRFSHLEQDGGGTYRHAIVLRGLAPGTRYFYEAASSAGDVQTGTFRTAPSPGQPLHFALHGDLQGGLDEAGARGVAARIAEEDPAFVVGLGDLADEAYGAAGFATWEPFFRICSNELARAVFMPALGNQLPAHGADPGRPLSRGRGRRRVAVRIGGR